MKKAYVENYGCSQNQSEGFMIQGILHQQAIQLTQDPKEADFLIVNTCAVKTCTEDKMISRIQKLHDITQQTKAKLLVSGCLPAVSAKRIQSIGMDIELPGLELEKLAASLSLPKEAYCPDQVQQNANPVIEIIPISVGCLSKCTFCATRLARGVLKSYPQEKILAAIQNGLANGKKEFWLTSTDCGCYGFDHQSNLAKLTQTILKEIPGDYRIRLGMANPQHLKFFFSELLEVFQDPRVYRFLHIPVQSGNNQVLKDMLRNYSSQTFLDMVSSARAKYPDMTIATDLIVGFPTENEEAFQETAKLIQAAQPDVINISKFGRRPGTVAHQLTPLSSHEINRRSQLLTKVANEVMVNRHQSNLGNESLVLVNEVGRKGNAVGRTQNYTPIPVDAPLGSWVRMRLETGSRTFVTGQTLTVF